MICRSRGLLAAVGLPPLSALAHDHTPRWLAWARGAAALVVFAFVCRYETLSDEKARREYDQYGGEGAGQHGRGRGRGHGGWQQGQGRGGQRHHQHPFFNQFFQQQQQNPYSNDEDHLSLRQLLNLQDGSDLQPTVVQFMHSHYRFVQPEVWQRLTADLGALGIRAGVADAGRSRYLLHDLSVTQFEIRAYYRGRVVRGPYLDGQISPGAISAFVAEWLTGGGMTARLFGPNANLTLLQEVDDISGFVRGHAGADPWRPKVVYLAPATESAHGSPIVAALALQHGEMADFAVLRVPGRPDADFHAKFRTFAFKHGVVSAPALVFFWPAGEGKSSGTLNQHSLNQHQVTRVMQKVKKQYDQHHRRAADPGAHARRPWGSSDDMYRRLSAAWLFVGTGMSGAPLEMIIAAVVGLFMLVINLQLAYIGQAGDGGRAKAAVPDPNHNLEQRRARAKQLRADEQRLSQLLRFVPSSELGAGDGGALSCPKRCGHAALEGDTGIAIAMLNVAGAGTGAGAGAGCGVTCGHVALWLSAVKNRRARHLSFYELDPRSGAWFRGVAAACAAGGGDAGGGFRVLAVWPRKRKAALFVAGDWDGGAAPTRKHCVPDEVAARLNAWIDRIGDGSLQWCAYAAPGGDEGAAGAAGAAVVQEAAAEAAEAGTGSDGSGDVDDEDSGDDSGDDDSGDGGGSHRDESGSDADSDE